MNKTIQEIASIIESQIDSKSYKFHHNELTNKQLEEINNFVSNFSKTGGFFPFPLKHR